MRQTMYGTGSGDCIMDTRILVATLAMALLFGLVLLKGFGAALDKKATWWKRTLIALALFALLFLLGVLTRRF